ncbi:Acetylornithine deacetylase/Succinyl-diaminopimelate desuccinylase [Gaiella occulta]|uniref:Acetylornithine deacetylase/Succinyl-diaminopimelate desuccinylase n=1 Tax=Gaiella occulta TaxID=1002870 RepID=A0A7M2YU10_9ACTN|nr:M20/M25/M40 family metallo-hydrolase [Gaiella occulta]RDI73631.1 Acetylornithine deacetylase/Succinyl-diaminopimelate desuccinylase [Gaiella occulta]
MTDERRTARLVADLIAIAEIPAPTFDEVRRIDWLEQRLTNAPGTRTRDDAGNLVWRWSDGKPRVLVAAHVDNVFAAETDLTVRRADGLLVGPGVGDNAAAIAVTLNVVEQLLDERPLAPGAVAFTVGEEGLGNLRGARAAIAALAPRLFIAVEGHLIDHVLVDAVGSVRAQVCVEGPGGHPWVDRGRPSALHELLAVGHELLKDGIGGSSVNIGLASGGRSVNSIADHAELVVECRSLDPVTLDRFEALLRELEVPPPLTVRAEVLGRRPAGRLDHDHDLLRTVMAARTELGLDTLLEAGSTDANVALSSGIPALTLGVARGGDMHTSGEWIDESSLEIGYRQLELVIRQLLS